MRVESAVEEGLRFVKNGVVLLPLVLSGWVLPAGVLPAGDRPVLARVELDRPLAELGVPVFAHLVDGQGCEYAIVKAPCAALDAAGVPYRVIDVPADDAGYLIAAERRPGAAARAARRHAPLLDDGRQVVVHGRPGVAEELLALGMATWRVPDRPLVLTDPETRPLAAPVSYDPYVAAMVAEVDQAAVLSYCRQLSGAEATTIGGAPYTISRRQTNSGAPIEKATQFAAEHLERQGLISTYQSWSGGGYSNRNVAAVLLGSEHISEVVLVTAHIDDMPATGTAPGADDNASGSVAVMLAAEIMRQYTFERTVHFVFFTGEEQGLWGSEAYAEALFDAGVNVVAVLNLDMIAYENVGAPVVSLHTRVESLWDPGYLADVEIANTFIDVVSLYGLSGSLQPDVVADGILYSDHSEFWSRGYPAILAIEDDNDFNPYYHKVTDVVGNLAPAYFTAFVKAAVGTTAHLAGPTGVVCEPPDAPVLSVPAASTSGAPYLVSWTETSADGTYELQEAADAGFVGSTTFDFAAAAVTFVHSGETDATYHYRVRAAEACDGGAVASDWSVAGQTAVEGGAGCAIEVANRTITATEVVESCGALSVGPEVDVAAGGSVTLRGATVVVIRNGFSVAAAAGLAAGVDAALLAR